MSISQKVFVILGIVTLVAASTEVHAKSRFNFSLNVGPSYPYPVYAPVPVYQPYYAPYYHTPYYPVVREYVPYPPVYQSYSSIVCSYDYWGRPYNCMEVFY